MYETEARHYLREVLMAAVHRADEGCADWRIADALLDAGEITWNYQIRPEPQVATFQLIFTAEPASGGVVEPSGPLTAEVATPFVSIRADPLLHGHSDGSGFDPNCADCRLKRAAEEATPDCVVPGLAELLDTDEEIEADAVRTARLPENPPGVGWRLARDEEIQRRLHDPGDERRADDAHMAAGEAWMEHDAEGEDRG